MTDTTHIFLEDCAIMLADHGCAEVAAQVRRCKKMIPDVPMSESIEITELREERQELLEALKSITAGLDDSRDTQPLIFAAEVKRARAAIRRAVGDDDSQAAH